MQPTAEHIQFDLCFKSVFWHRPAVIEVQIDSKTVFKKILDQPECKVAFTQVLSFGDHRLSIVRSNKSDDQCLVTADGEKKDQYIILERVRIDGIDIQNLIWHRSWFEPQYPETWRKEQEAAGIVVDEKVIGETWLSHNGVWQFDFSSPFYKFVISQFEH